MKKESKDFLKTLLITYAIIIAAVYFLDKGALQEILMKPKSKYLIIMDLEDAEHDLRDAEREYKEVEREKKTLEKWGFGREIPSELLGELASQKKEVQGLKLIVKKMNERYKQFDIKFLREEIVKGVDVRDTYDEPVRKSKRWADGEHIDVRDAYDYEDSGCQL